MTYTLHFVKDDGKWFIRNIYDDWDGHISEHHKWYFVNDRIEQHILNALKRNNLKATLLNHHISVKFDNDIDEAQFIVMASGGLKV